MKKMNLMCMLILTLTLSVTACSSSSDAVTDDEADTPATTDVNVVDKALAVMPSMDAAASASVAASASKEWEAEDKRVMRNDIAFEVVMRFMDESNANFEILSVGNESLISNLGNFYAPDLIDADAGTQEESYEDQTFEVIIGAPVEIDGTTGLPVIDFGLTTPYANLTAGRKVSIDLFSGISDYIAWGEDADGLVHIADSSIQVNEMGTEGKIIYANFNEETADLNFYYMGNVAYTAGDMAGEHFMIRMDLVGNETTKEFTLKTTKREIKADRDNGDAGGLAMIAKGVAEGAGNFYTIYAVNGTCALDADNCLLTEPTDERWFCVKADITSEELEAFIRSAYNDEGTLVGDTPTYTNTDAMEAADNYADLALSATCLTDGALIEAMSFIAPNDTDMPSEITEYSATFGIE